MSDYSSKHYSRVREMVANLPPGGRLKLFNEMKRFCPKCGRVRAQGGKLETVDWKSVIDAVDDAHFSAVEDALQADDLDALLTENMRSAKR